VCPAVRALTYVCVCVCVCVCDTLGFPLMGRAVGFVAPAIPPRLLTAPLKRTAKSMKD